MHYCQHIFFSTVRCYLLHPTPVSIRSLLILKFPSALLVLGDVAVAVKVKHNTNWRGFTRIHKNSQELTRTCKRQWNGKAPSWLTSAIGGSIPRKGIPHPCRFYAHGFLAPHGFILFRLLIRMIKAIFLNKLKFCVTIRSSWLVWACRWGNVWWWLRTGLG